MARTRARRGTTRAAGSMRWIDDNANACTTEEGDLHSIGVMEEDRVVVIPYN